MTVLASKNSATVTLLAGETLNVDKGGQGIAVLKIGAQKGTPISLGTTPRQIGPFSFDMPIVVQATSGSLSYNIWPSESIPDFIERDSFGNPVSIIDPETDVVTATLRQAKNDVMLGIGDSLMDRGWTTSETTRASNWIHLANCLAGAPFYPVDAGVSGETTAQILARVPAAIDDNNPAMIIFGPNSVNDISGSVPSATTISNLQAMFDLGVRSGAIVIICTVHDGTSGAALNAAASNYHRKWYREVNTFIRNYASSNPVYLHDFAAIFNDPAAGGPKSGFDQAADGRHLSFRGSYRQAQALYNNILSKLPSIKRNIDSRFNPRNMLAPFGAVVGNNATTVNGFLLGTGASGTGPNAWGYRRDSGDAVSTIDGTAGVTANTADVGLGGNKATITVTAGGDGKGGGFAIPQNGATKRFSNPRANTTAYTWGDRIAIDSTRSATVFAAGTSAGSAPDFTGLVAGDTVVDGTVTWMVTDRPKAGDKLRVLVDFDATLSSGSGGVFAWVAITDTAGTATFNTYCLGTTGSDFTTYGLQPDFSLWANRSTLRHEFTIPAGTAEVGECSVRVFFVGANTSACTINLYSASMEIVEA